MPLPIAGMADYKRFVRKARRTAEPVELACAQEPGDADESMLREDSSEHGRRLSASLLGEM